MNASDNSDIEVWEGEGGASALPGFAAILMKGTVSQVEWAQRIRRQVDADFIRVAACFRAVADRQSDDLRAGTEAILAILDDKRAEVMSNERAGYFIRDWQEITDQVRQLIFHDPRYQAIKSSRTARRRISATGPLAAGMGGSARSQWQPRTDGRRTQMNKRTQNQTRPAAGAKGKGEG